MELPLFIPRFVGGIPPTIPILIPPPIVANHDCSGATKKPQPARQGAEQKFLQRSKAGNRHALFARRAK